MDRNLLASPFIIIFGVSLSARRAWIEIDHQGQDGRQLRVALRKESVDRNRRFKAHNCSPVSSLSARRAWIEIDNEEGSRSKTQGRSPQGERG